MILGFDLDGVLYPWHRSALVELQVYNNINDSYEEFWGGNYKKFPEKFWKEFTKIEHLYGNMNINPEALETLYYFSEKYTIYYITNRPREVRFATWSWMRRNKLPQQENLIFTEDKLPFLVEHNIDLFVEDRIDNAVKLKDVTNLILFRQPHNREIWDQFTCINSIKELKEIIR